MDIHIALNDHTDNGLEIRFAGLIERVVTQTLLKEAPTVSVDVSVCFVGSLEIRQANKKFRRIDRETDVLSFPLIDFQNEGAAVLAAGGRCALGDILISYEAAERQAAEYGHSVEREVAFLTAHSLLHLLGYDHEDKADETVMFDKQEQILTALMITR